MMLMLSFAWIGREARRDETALARDVRSVQSSRPLGELKSCLGHELRMDVGRQRDVWSGSAHKGRGLIAFNSMTDIGVRLYELGGVRKVIISTRRARPLRPAELKAIERCVRGAA